MGILSRFRDVMKANIGDLLKRSEDPVKTIDQYMRQMMSDLGQVKAETASVLADESRAKRNLDECQAEIRKLQRYAEKAVESGNEDGALKFLDKKAQLARKLHELEAAYQQAAAKATAMNKMQDKLISDMNRLEARQTELKGKIAEAGQYASTGNSSAGNVDSAFRAAEQKADQALNEALALAELRSGAQEDDLDELIAQLEKGMNTGNATAETDTQKINRPEDELAAIKVKLQANE